MDHRATELAVLGFNFIGQHTSILCWNQRKFHHRRVIKHLTPLYVLKSIIGACTESNNSNSLATQNYNSMPCMK